MTSRPTAVPSVFEENVECVEPAPNTSGLISSSRAQMPDSGFRPLVIALPNIMMSGFTPKFARPQSLPARWKPIWISSSTSRILCFFRISCSIGKYSGGGIT